MEHQLCFKLSFLSFTSEVFNKILLYTPVFNMMMGLLLNFRFATAPFLYQIQLTNMVAEEGFEPSQTESESAVLPLHNSAILFLA